MSVGRHNTLSRSVAAGRTGRLYAVAVTGSSPVLEDVIEDRLMSL